MQFMVFLVFLSCPKGVQQNTAKDKDALRVAPRQVTSKYGTALGLWDTDAIGCFGHGFLSFL